MVYSYDRSGGKRTEKVVPNDKGVLIAKPFEMKVSGISNTEIAIA